MDKIAIAKRTGNFLNADLDDLVNSTGMYRSWIPDLGKKTFKNSLVPHELEYNSLDELNNKHLSAETKDKIKVIYSISKALNALRNDRKHPYQKILILKYFDANGGLSNPKIAATIKYSIRVFYIKKRDALVEFSKAFLNAQKQCNVNSIINLIDADNEHISNDNSVVAFLNTLSDKQALNLYATLLRAKSNITVKQAHKQASISYSFDNLKSILNESL